MGDKRKQAVLGARRCLQTYRTPFGWFSTLQIDAKGHPLSRVARIVTAGGQTPAWSGCNLYAMHFRCRRMTQMSHDRFPMPGQNHLDVHLSHEPSAPHGAQTSVTGVGHLGTFSLL